MNTLRPQTIHDEAFSAFGQVLHETAAKPMMDTAEATYWGGIAKFSSPQNLSSGYLKSRRTDPVVTQMEQHTKTGEILVAMKGDAVICMATPESEVGTDNVQLGAFLVREGEAIKMHVGTWHWLPMPVGCDEASYLVLFGDDTENSDLDVVELAEPVQISNS
jgi:ureidoglycolate hydrolase